MLGRLPAGATGAAALPAERLSSKRRPSRRRMRPPNKRASARHSSARTPPMTPLPPISKPQGPPGNPSEAHRTWRAQSVARTERGAHNSIPGALPSPARRQLSPAAVASVARCRRRHRADAHVGPRCQDEAKLLAAEVACAAPRCPPAALLLVAAVRKRSV